MKPEKHPSYHPVVFRDRAAGYAFLTRSTATSDTTIEWDDGGTYPVVDVEISSESHPFHTGKARTVDAEGRIAQFRRRYGDVEPIPEEPTGDRHLHTGSDTPVSPEDLVLASGRDVTPENLEWARHRIATEGREAIERELP